jgi:hypothetical protein
MQPDNSQPRQPLGQSGRKVIQPSESLLKELETKKQSTALPPEQVATPTASINPVIASTASVVQPNVSNQSNDGITLSNAQESASTGILPTSQLSTPSETVKVSKFSTPDLLVTEKPKSSYKTLYLSLVSALIFLIVISGIVYFFIFPSRWDNKYLSSVKTAYNSQSNQMLTVYESLSRPVFASNNSSVASDTKDLAYANSVIKKANSSTSSLSSANHLTVLPGTKILGSVKQTDKKYKAMRQYITDSQNFLTDYQSVSTYMSQFNSIASTQLTPLFDKINSYNIGPNTSTDQLLTISQNSAASIDGIVTSLDGLNPPPDLNNFHTSLVNDLNAWSNDFLGIANGINNNNYQLFVTSANNLDQDANKLIALASSDFAGNFQRDSKIHKEVVKLETENPLGSPKNINQPSAPQPKGIIST